MQNKMPDNIAVSKALDLLKSDPESLTELKHDYDQLVVKYRTEEYSTDAKTAINDTLSVATYIHEQRADLKQKLWDGTITDEELEMLKPGYFSFQESMAQQALKELDSEVRAEKLSNVTMVFDIDDQSKFVRGYLSNGKQLDPNDEQDKKVIDILDQSFHSWLLRQNLVSVDGVIYKNDKLKAGKPTQKANPELVSSLLVDAEKGLAKKQENAFALEVRSFKGKSAEATAASQAQPAG